MSFLAKLFIEEEVRTLFKVNYTFQKEVDMTGCPFTIPLGGYINLTFELTGKDDLFFDWMMADTMTKKGYIRFYKRDAISKFFDLEFWDCHCVYNENQFDAASDTHATISLTLSPAIFRIRDNLFQKQWKTTDINASKKAAALVADNGPVITSVQWVSQEKETISESSYGELVGVSAQIQNAQGGTAKIVVAKKDGSDLEDGVSTLTFNESVDNEGLVMLSSVKIKEIWEDFKVEERDQLRAQVLYNGEQRKSEALTLLPQSKVLVHFRPHSNYKGEYGFDWMRMGDTGKPGDVWYKDIVGSNKTGKFIANNTDYVKLGKEYKQLPHPIKPKDFYLEPVMTLLPGKSAKLSLKVEVKDADAKKITFKYDDTLLTLSQTEVSYKTVGKKELADYLEITCIKEFGKDQYIEVLANGVLAGKLKILANDKTHRYKAEVVFVEIETELSTGTLNKGTAIGEEDFIKKYLNQALIKPSLVTKTLDLKKDTILNSTYRLLNQGNTRINDIIGIHAHLEVVFAKAHPGYSNHFKVFFFNEEGGEILYDNQSKKSYYQGYNGAAKSINSKAVVLYNTHNTSTTTHELLHAMGVYHSFSDNGKFTFKKNKTENIMDYSHNVGIDRISTWQWQWENIWPNVIKE